MLEPVIQDETVNGHLAQYPTTQFISISANGHDDSRTSHGHQIGFVTSLPRSGKNRRSIGDQQKFPRALSTVSPAENARLFPLLQQFFRHPHRDGRFARSAHREVPDTDYRTRQPPWRQPSLFIQPRPHTRSEPIRAGKQRFPSIHHRFVITLPLQRIVGLRFACPERSVAKLKEAESKGYSDLQRLKPTTCSTILTFLSTTPWLSSMTFRTRSPI